MLTCIHRCINEIVRKMYKPYFILANIKVLSCEFPVIKSKINEQQQ